ncbi:MAG TPA: ribose-phosphate diphosphokinase [Casimicrobiaceae bacterium]|nr:ribose-phosphate diphosphokinase [Casimicrobiaceae bacterium]
MDSLDADDDPVLFALGASHAFGERVADATHVALSAHEEREFEDGEHKTRSLVNVRDRDVYVVHSLYGDAEQSGNDKIVKLLLFIGALKDAAAARVTAVVPYLAYARKDRKSKTRDPVATRYIAQMFEAVGVDGVVTLDVHNLAAYQNAFRCRAEHLEANGLFVRHFAEALGGREAVVVSPDAGGIKRAEDFRRRLEAALGRPVDIGFAEKHRSAGVVSGEAFVGEVSGRDAIIIDDLISSGTTIVRAAETCRLRGAARVYAAASHGIFAAGADRVLASEALDAIVITDSIPPLRLADQRVRAKVTQISVAALFGEAIRRMHGGGSIVDLLEN